MLGAVVVVKYVVLDEVNSWKLSEQVAVSFSSTSTDVWS
jgi:hypothetical protein